MSLAPINFTTPSWGAQQYPAVAHRPPPIPPRKSPQRDISCERQGRDSTTSHCAGRGASSRASSEARERQNLRPASAKRGNGPSTPSQSRPGSPHDGAIDKQHQVVATQGRNKFQPATTPTAKYTANTRSRSTPTIPSLANAPVVNSLYPPPVPSRALSSTASSISSTSSHRRVPQSPRGSDQEGGKSEFKSQSRTIDRDSTTEASLGELVERMQTLCEQFQSALNKYHDLRLTHA